MLDHSVRIDDDVVLDCSDRYSNPWDKVPNGTKGKVVAREIVTRHRGRYGIDRYFGRQSGIYQELGNPSVLFETGQQVVVPTHLLKWVDDEVVYAQRLAAYRAMPGTSVERDAILNQTTRIADLPNTKFWEGDICKIISGDFAFYGDERGLVRVQSIQWNWDDTPYHVEWVHPVTLEYASRGSTYLKDANLELVQRGNVWREAHGEPLIFRNIEEEVIYAHNTGRTDEVRNPATGNFAWTKNEVLKAIEENIGHAFVVSGHPFVFDAGHISVWSFHDADLATRARKAVLNGFNIEA